MVRSAVGTAVFFFLAPGTMAGLVPWAITNWERPTDGLGPVDVLGGALVLLGLAAVVACFVRFVVEGRGTPAPVAPTETLVVGGLYRYVRNPMYVAVASIIGGQAVLFRSPGTAVWLLVFLMAVVGFVKIYEEPELQSQFGDAYEQYRRAVPGWWPRFSPYRG
jgi:protein-S-isoprenylcysteine O-methyltransferase Ste14